MSEKSEFADGENLRQFLVQVKRVVEWLHENGEKYGLTEKVNDGTVSRALRGEQFDHRLTDALDALHCEAMRDPWKWCAPPETVEELTGLPWWHETLKPDVPLNTWNLMRKRPLSEDRRVKAQGLLDEYRARLKAVCDMHAADARLKMAWAADVVHPGYDDWVEVDGLPLNYTQNPWALLDREGGRFVEVSPGVTRQNPYKQIETAKRRRAPEGMHTVLRDFAATNKTSDELVELAARASALQDVDMLLPDVQECKLSYEVSPDEDDYEAAQAIVDQALLSGFVDAMAPKFAQGDTWDVSVHNRYYHPDTFTEAQPVVLRYTWTGQDYSCETVESWQPDPPKSEAEKALDREVQQAWEGYEWKVALLDKIERNKS